MNSTDRRPRRWRLPASAGALGWALSWALLAGCASSGGSGLSDRERRLVEADLGSIPHGEAALTDLSPIGEYLAALDVRIARWTSIKNRPGGEQDPVLTVLEGDLERFVRQRQGELEHELQTGPLRNRWIAAAGLGFARNPAALGPLLAALDDPVRDVQVQALFGLGLLADPATPVDRPLRELRDGAEPEVRVNAAYCLFRLARTGARSPELAPVLRLALVDPEGAVRAQAAATLGVLGTGDAVADLGQCLDDELPFVALSAARALQSIAEQDRTRFGPVARELVRALEVAGEPHRSLLRRELVSMADADHGQRHEEWRRWAYGLP
jgi:hypothetical protein